MDTTDNNISPEEFKRHLSGFCGTTNYYEHKVIDNLKLLLTDGCDFVREAANARWLFNEILLNQPSPEIKALDFQVWVLWFDKDDDDDDDDDEGCWVVRCEDGNYNTVLVQMIVDSDFPIKEFRLFVVDGVAMLPSEY